MVDGVIMEKFQLDPIGLYSEGYNLDFYDPDNSFMSNLLSEATSGQVPKKGVIPRIIGTIVSIFKWIGKQLKKFINFIANLFKRKSKTADQIMSEITGSDSWSMGSLSFGDTGASDNISVSSNSSNNTSSSSAKSSSSQSNGTNGSSSMKIEIPSDPKSEVTPPNIDLMFKPLQIQFNNDKQSININFGKAINTGKNDPSVPHKGYLRNGSDMCFVAGFISFPEGMNYMTECCKIIASGNLDDPKLKEYYNKLDRIWDEGFRVQHTHEIPLQKLAEFDSKIQEINKVLEVMNTSGTMNQNGMIGVTPSGHIGEVKYDSRAVIKIVNGLANKVNILQMGLNGLLGCMSQVYAVDGRYQGSVKDIETLSQFVQKCMEGNIPGKYIMWNSYIVCDTSIKGSVGNRLRPIWGQSRFVFLPDGDKAYKIAYNSMGLRANRNEIAITNKFKEIKIDRLIAKITTSSKNNYVIGAEKVDGENHPNMTTAAKLADQINDTLEQHKVPYQITDTHNQNFAKRGNDYVLVDYGDMRRL